MSSSSISSLSISSVISDFKEITKIRLSLSVVFSSLEGYLLGADTVSFYTLLFLAFGGYFMVGASNAFNHIIEKDLDDLKSDVHKIQVAFKSAEIPEDFRNGLDILYEEQRGSVLLCIVRGKEESVTAKVNAAQPVLFDLLPLTLEEIFIYEMGDVGYAIESIMV